MDNVNKKADTVLICGGYAIAPKAPGELTRLCMISESGNSDQMDILREIDRAAGLGHDEALKSANSPRNLLCRMK